MSVALNAKSPYDDKERPAPFDPSIIRDDFPILAEKVHGRPLVYLDNGASTQKPRAVIEAMRCAYETYYANVHRGVHLLSQRSTDKFEAARRTVARFLNASSTDEIVFVRGATEAINLVAATWGRAFLSAGDEIILTQLEHHANIVPWQLLRDEKGIVLRVVPINDDGSLRMDEFHAMLSKRTKLVAVTHVSNALGVITPVEEIIEAAHARGARVLLDGCQGVQHQQVDVQALDADFYVFSGHKLYGPTAIGVLYAKMHVLETMPPYQGGGDMIESVTFEKTTFKRPPHRFEAGTPAIVEAIGFAAAIEYVEAVGLPAISEHEHDLLTYATARLQTVPGLRIYGTAAPKTAILSFTLNGAHPHDVGTILDHAGVAIRAGHHCAQPLMERLDVAATARASFAMYNTRDDVDALIDALMYVRKVFG
jgi:cysteine desulfurases, SufS subfamily